MEAATVTDLPKIEAEEKSDAYMRWLDLQDTLDGIRTAAKRHDAQARQKYYKHLFETLADHYYFLARRHENSILLSASSH